MFENVDDLACINNENKKNKPVDEAVVHVVSAKTPSRREVVYQHKTLRKKFLLSNFI